MRKQFTFYPEDDLLIWLKSRAEKNLRSCAKEIEVILLKKKQEEETTTNETV